MSLVVGDLVWVRTGLRDHEEPATVVEIVCKTPNGEDGIKCKIHISSIVAIYSTRNVRSLTNNGRRRSRGQLQSSAQKLSDISNLEEATSETGKKPSTAKRKRSSSRGKKTNEKKPIPKVKVESDTENDFNENPSKKRKSLETTTKTTSSPHFDGGKKITKAKKNAQKSNNTSRRKICSPIDGKEGKKSSRKALNLIDSNNESSNSYVTGDLVWVRTGLGDHEEPATVVELGCQTQNGEDGIKCKQPVSSVTAIYSARNVRPFTNGRTVRRRSSTRFYSKETFDTEKSSAATRKRLSRGKKPNEKESVPKVKVESVVQNECNKKPIRGKKPSEKEPVPKVKVESDVQNECNEKPSKKRKTRETITTATSSPYFDGRKKKEAKKSTQKSTSRRKIDLSSDGKNVKEEEKSRKAPNLIVSNDFDDSNNKEEPPLSMLKKKDKGSKSKNNKTKPDDAKGKKPTNKEKKPKKEKKLIKEKKIIKEKKPKQKKKSVPKLIVASDDDSDKEVDRPFKVEYSRSGRATCRRCDIIIKKGELRVSHAPLFRGKPGFTIYKHLKCMMFSEEVKTPQDVGGWKKLSPEDLKVLEDRIKESKEEARKEAEELDPDELVPVAFNGEIRAPPPGLSANLLPFQVEGVSWMHCQERGCNSNVRGGILADEMGMGKTLQTITTLLDNQPKLQHSKPGVKHPAAEKDVRESEESLWSKALLDWNHEMEKNGVPKSVLPKATSKKIAGGARAGTLVICPLIALTQWKEEIKKFTESSDTLNVGIYHGPDRAVKMPREMMCKYDVILTTYQCLQADFRKMASPNRIKCPNCGGRFKIDKLRVHLKYFCGEGAQRTEAQARQRRSRDENNNSIRRGGAKKSEKASPEKGNSQKVKSFPQKQIRKVSDESSESEISDVERKVHKKTSRRAAMTASKRMSVSKKDWKDSNNADDSDEYEDFQDDSSSDEEFEDVSTRRKKPPQTIRKPVSSDTESEDKGEVARARQKQEEALAFSSGKKKRGPKVFSEKKGKMKKKKPRAKVKNGQKKFLDDDSDDSDDDFVASKIDPMANIDLDALVKEAMAGSKMSILHSFCWWRIVLDEAHMIKSRSSQTAGAAFALTSVHRWCLSGTPLQNRVGEIYSLIRFLRIDPMAHYFCRAKGCNCKSLHYRMMNGRCQDCGHASVQHFSYFNKHVLNPIQRAGYSGDGRRAMFKLKSEILDKSLLRRTKQNRAADMKLPPRIVTIRSVRLHPREEDFYNALYTQTQSSFNDYIAEGTLLNNYAHIFDLLMRMRQAVDHPYLVIYSKREFKARGSNGIAVANGSSDCSICHEPPIDVITSTCCEAPFCRTCVQDYMAVSRGGNSVPCPSCRAPFSIDLNQTSNKLASIISKQNSEPMPSLKELRNVATGSILRRINLAEYATSSKIEALVEELVRMRETSPGSKAIVFSQFVNMLDLIRWRLHSDPCLKGIGIGAQVIHGGMNIKARDESLKAFREDMNERVLLMSLKAGGVALNLTVANHIYLMDPWWNPAAEYQAIDRTHRLGQYRAIRAVRFVSEDTVEERILQLQEKKRLVFDGTIGRDAGSLRQLTVEDMKALFT